MKRFNAEAFEVKMDHRDYSLIVLIHQNLVPSFHTLVFGKGKCIKYFFKLMMLNTSVTPYTNDAVSPSYH